ncbi:hypothetical protein CCGE531_26285 (plasmid) [Rhizobium sp. CCGE531]|nr:hypothetical protein CCGE531_26285 [Rhizobium sp. CCGE531]AYG75894.1 hypothetical protein CCGE532_25790 [Rhizobium sp. CCGE532]
MTASPCPETRADYDRSLCAGYIERSAQSDDSDCEIRLWHGWAEAHQFQEKCAAVFRPELREDKEAI